jgi:carboxypeptidase C (cathepsin A)
MKTALMLATALALVTGTLAATAAAAADKPGASANADKKPVAGANSSPDAGVLFQPETSTSEGSVATQAGKVDYKAIAGTLIVHPKGWDDAAWRSESDSDLGDKKNAKAEAAMSYVAYFKKGVAGERRPIIFLYNGGPGSSTIWLHMGAFGPRRVVTTDDQHTPAAPYNLVNNAYTLLDVADLVFIDAPGTGFGRIAGKDKEKAFWGVDADAFAFEEFIKGFLSKYGRWNSPKYLFGESYGTPRSAVLVNNLETGSNVDFNGVILLSQILNFDLSIDTGSLNPGSDEAYIVGLPSYAATAWYHNRIAGGRPPALEPYLKEVEQFANGEYAQALQMGTELDPARRQAVAEKLAGYIGLPVAYVLKSDLRIEGGQFSKMLQDADGLTTGRLDSRFSGPDMDPLSKEADYDPLSASMSSAYITAFNDYARKALGVGSDKVFKPEIDVFKDWDFAHQQPGMPFAIRGATNVMPDLASAMKYNPNLKVALFGGYYDLGTPFYEGYYEMHHLPMPASLQNNIEYHYYQSGHMVYAHQESLKMLHDDVANFVRRTDNVGG